MDVRVGEEGEGICGRDDRRELVVGVRSIGHGRLSDDVRGGIGGGDSGDGVMM